jgi:hypothetical protein
MPIKFKCPHCQALLEAGSDLAGKKGTCPKCSKAITVPKTDSGPQSEGKQTTKKD